MTNRMWALAILMTSALVAYAQGYGVADQERRAAVADMMAQLGIG